MFAETLNTKRCFAKNVFLIDMYNIHYVYFYSNTEYRDFQQEDTLSFLNSVLNGIQTSLKRLKLDKQIGNLRMYVDKCTCKLINIKSLLTFCL